MEGNPSAQGGSSLYSQGTPQSSSDDFHKCGLGDTMARWRVFSCRGTWTAGAAVLGGAFVHPMTLRCALVRAQEPKGPSASHHLHWKHGATTRPRTFDCFSEIYPMEEILRLYFIGTHTLVKLVQKQSLRNSWLVYLTHLGFEWLESETLWGPFIFLPPIGGLRPTEGKSVLNSCKIPLGVNRKTLSFTGNQSWYDCEPLLDAERFWIRIKKKKKLMFIWNKLQPFQTHFYFYS